MLNNRPAALTLALLLTLPLSAPLSARSADPLIDVSAGNVDTDHLPQAAVRLGNVTVTPDITYSIASGYRPMLLDLYRSEGKALRPLVIFLHGGSWSSGSKRTTANFTNFPEVLASLARRGFVVASVDYRLSGEAQWTAALDDIKSSIRFLRAHAKQYGIDPEHVAIWGASSGAHLAALAAFTGDDLDFEKPGMEHAGQSDRVQALVGWYGPYELGDLFSQNLTSTAQPPATTTSGPLAFFGCTVQGCPPGVIGQASPVTHVDAGDPPTLLIHGTADTTVPATHSRKLQERLKAAGVNSKLILIDGVSHDWIGKEPQSTQKAYRQAVTATFDWLEQTFCKKGD
ncbi:MAG: alpha/beta hydrolase [Chlorobiaceae bacterium]|nr:alpha/beta hydrolase [Chlorobiaceae bacterium]